MNKQRTERAMTATAEAEGLTVELSAGQTLSIVVTSRHGVKKVYKYTAPGRSYPRTRTTAVARHASLVAFILKEGHSTRGTKPYSLAKKKAKARQVVRRYASLTPQEKAALSPKGKATIKQLEAFLNSN